VNEGRYGLGCSARVEQVAAEADCHIELLGMPGTRLQSKQTATAGWRLGTGQACCHTDQQLQAAHLEPHDEGLALHVGEGQVEVADVAVRRVRGSVDDHRVQLTHDALLQTLRQCGDVPADVTRE
jgi:hypothetical protein